MAKNKPNKVDTKNMSKSKAKREAQRKQNEKMRRQRFISKLAGIVISAAVILLIAAAIGKQLYILAIRTTPGSDYSAELNEDGKINDVDPANAIALADYENISVPEDEVAATDEEVEEEINSVLEGYKELSTDTEDAIVDGDEVNIDYVGTIDGEEFEGGSSDGAGYDLTIGSGSFIDDFEQQLIGHKVGEEVTVEVTFPDDYQSADVAGKDASFAVTINGIQKLPELTDEFVAENLAESEDVSTAEEYRSKIENNFRDEHLEEYLTNYIMDNTTVNTYPKKYLKNIKSILKYTDGMGDDIEDEIEYEKELTERAKTTVKEALVYQAIFEKAGLTLDMDAYIAELTETNGEDYVNNMKTTYGESYMAQARMKELVIDYLKEKYK